MHRLSCCGALQQPALLLRGQDPVWLHLHHATSTRDAISLRSCDTTMTVHSSLSLPAATSLDLEKRAQILGLMRWFRMAVS